MLYSGKRKHHTLCMRGVFRYRRCCLTRKQQAGNLRIVLGRYLQCNPRRQYDKVYDDRNNKDRVL